jgi:hypothetical protein
MQYYVNCKNSYCSMGRTGNDEAVDMGDFAQQQKWRPMVDVGGSEPEFLPSRAFPFPRLARAEMVPSPRISPVSSFLLLVDILENNNFNFNFTIAAVQLCCSAISPPTVASHSACSFLDLILALLAENRLWLASPCWSVDGNS